MQVIAKKFPSRKFTENKKKNIGKIINYEKKLSCELIFLKEHFAQERDLLNIILSYMAFYLCFSIRKLCFQTKRDFLSFSRTKYLHNHFSIPLMIFSFPLKNYMLKIDFKRKVLKCFKNGKIEW